MSEISVFITTYNKAGILAETIQSVLNQSEPVKKIYILDNNSTDETGEVIKNYPEVTYIKHPENIGMIGNWNKCFELCETPYLCILHDDDLLDPDWHAAWLETVERIDDCGLYFSRAGMFNNQHRILSESNLYSSRRYEPGAIYDDLVAARMFSFPVSGTMIYNLTVIRDSGHFFKPYDANANSYPDIEFHARIADLYPVYYLNKRLFYSRQEYVPNRSETLSVNNNKDYYRAYIIAILPVLTGLYQNKQNSRSSISRLWFHYFFLSCGFTLMFRDWSYMKELRTLRNKMSISLQWRYFLIVWAKDLLKYSRFMILHKTIRT